MERDREVDAELRSLGWTVLRFWSRQVLRQTDECIQTVEEAIFYMITEEF